MSVFAVMTLLLLEGNSGATTEFGEVEARLSNGLMVVASLLMMIAVATVLVLSLRHGSWRSVEYSAVYVAACTAILVVAILVVVAITNFCAA